MFVQLKPYCGDDEEDNDTDDGGAEEAGEAYEGDLDEMLGG